MILASLAVATLRADTGGGTCAALPGTASPPAAPAASSIEPDCASGRPCDCARARLGQHGG